MLGGLFKLRLFPLFIAILDITGHAGWQYGKTVNNLLFNYTVNCIMAGRLKDAMITIIYFENLHFFHAKLAIEGLTLNPYPCKKSH